MTFRYSHIIYNEIFDIKRIKEFSDEWNQYSKGNASQYALYKDNKHYQAEVKKSNT